MGSMAFQVVFVEIDNFCIDLPTKTNILPY